jgi:hypothetical protein
MLIQDMTREMSVDLLKRTHIGRLGCAQGLQPYVVPFSFPYHREIIYSFATIGKKIEWMRANPLICVEADEKDRDVVGAWLRQDAAAGRRAAARADIFSDFDQRDFRPSRPFCRLAHSQDQRVKDVRRLEHARMACARSNRLRAWRLHRIRELGVSLRASVIGIVRTGLGNGRARLAPAPGRSIRSRAKRYSQPLRTAIPSSPRRSRSVQNSSILSCGDRVSARRCYGGLAVDCRALDRL